MAKSPEWGRDGTVMKYSCPQGTEVVHVCSSLSMCLIIRLKEKEELQRKVIELERITIEKRNAEELLMKWQTADLVLQGLFTSVSQIADDL